MIQLAIIYQFDTQATQLPSIIYIATQLYSQLTCEFCSQTLFRVQLAGYSYNRKFYLTTHYAVSQLQKHIASCLATTFYCVCVSRLVRLLYGDHLILHKTLDLAAFCCLSGCQKYYKCSDQAIKLFFSFVAMSRQLAGFLNQITLILLLHNYNYIC